MIQQSQIDEALATFDFETAAKIYQLMNWTWAPKGRIPTQHDLFLQAKDLLTDAANGFNETREKYLCATGGLRAVAYQEEWCDPSIELEMIALWSIG